jgi:hypothetical protein
MKKKKNRNRHQEALYRSKTMKHIAKFIYEQSGCNKCAKQEFCSRDGNKWGCKTSYQKIAEHLNDIAHLSSRGNEWSNKAVSRQFEYVSKRVTEKEKQALIQKQNEQRDAQTYWTKSAVHGVSEEDVINTFEGAETHIDNLDISTLTSEDDIDMMTSELNKQLKLHLQNKHLLRVLVIKSQS